MIEGLRDFVRESNKIEGIDYSKDNAHLIALTVFLNLDRITVEDMESFVSSVQPGARLRISDHMNVRIGGHVPIGGGPVVKTMLMDILRSANTHTVTAFHNHLAYENLHPFMDGNGRSGRALWLWQMKPSLVECSSFLHMFYYQTLMYTRK